MEWNEINANELNNERIRARMSFRNYIIYSRQTKQNVLLVHTILGIEYLGNLKKDQGDKMKLSRSNTNFMKRK
jgi:hypothetical protein